MEKKTYVAPRMEVVKMEAPDLLVGSGDAHSWWEDKNENVCAHGHNPHCDGF